MNKYTRSYYIEILILLVVVFIAGCSTGLTAKEPKGSWNSINTLGDKINVKELERPYYYGALPIDTSLNSMLTRWAEDTKLSVELRCRFDFSIPSKLLKSQMTSIRAAMYEISNAYFAHSVTIEFNSDKTAIVASCGPNDKTEFLKPPAIINSSNLKIYDLKP